MRETSEVLFNNRDVLAIDKEMIQLLKERAKDAPRRRYRLCMHHSAEDRVQEMVIAYAGGSYNRPHCHPQSSSSVYLIDGELDVVIFDESGNVIERIEMAPVGSGRQFCLRLQPGCWHMDLPRTEQVVIYETIGGPFNPETSNQYAEWAPDAADQGAVAAFLTGITN